MSITRKYSRSYHYPFSPGTTSDDRINHEYWEDLQKIEEVVDTEKLDGENSALTGYGKFSRSHDAPTVHPWTRHLDNKFLLIQNDLRINDLEIFGENLYAIHSIKYTNLPQHFFVFGVRCLDMWLSWEEVKWYAEFYEYPVVPELSFRKPVDEQIFKNEVLELVNQPSVFGSIDNHTNEICWIKEQMDEYERTINQNWYALDEYIELSYELQKLIQQYNLYVRQSKLERIISHVD